MLYDRHSVKVSINYFSLSVFVSTECCVYHTIWKTQYLRCLCTHQKKKQQQQHTNPWIAQLCFCFGFCWFFFVEPAKVFAVGDVMICLRYNVFDGFAVFNRFRCWKKKLSLFAICPDSHGIFARIYNLVVYSWVCGAH